MQKLLIVLFLIPMIYGCSGNKSTKYVYFFHNQFLEGKTPEDIHDQYGKVEYEEILEYLEGENRKVISEIRPADVDFDAYVKKKSDEIKTLIEEGVNPSDITLIGTSKGGYITQSISSGLRNKQINYVIVGAFNTMDNQSFQWHGNFLNIYDVSDSYGVSAQGKADASGEQIGHFKEVRLNTGMDHGFLFKAMPLWLEPAKQWSEGDYNFRTSY